MERMPHFEEEKEKIDPVTYEREALKSVEKSPKLKSLILGFALLTASACSAKVEVSGAPFTGALTNPWGLTKPEKFCDVVREKLRRGDAVEMKEHYDYGDEDVYLTARRDSRGNPTGTVKIRTRYGTQRIDCMK